MLKLIIISLLFQISELNVDQEDKMPYSNSDTTVEAIFEAYNDYKKDDIDLCSKRLKGIGLTNIKSTESIVPKDILIDTVVFHDASALRWVFFRSVDLEYLKTVNGHVTFQADNVESTVASIINRFQRLNANLKVERCEEQDKVILKDMTSYVVLDKRWKEETSSLFTSFYTYTITTFDDMIDISFEEIVPRDFVILDVQLTMKSELK